MRRTIGAEEVEALTLSLLASGATIVGLWLVCPSYALFEAFLLGWRRGVKRKQRHELQRHVMHYCVLASGWIYLRQCLLNMVVLNRLLCTRQNVSSPDIWFHRCRCCGLF